MTPGFWYEGSLLFIDVEYGGTRPVMISLESEIITIAGPFGYNDLLEIKTSSGETFQIMSPFDPAKTYLQQIKHPDNTAFAHQTNGFTPQQWHTVLKMTRKLDEEKERGNRYQEQAAKYAGLYYQEKSKNDRLNHRVTQMEKEIRSINKEAFAQAQ